MSWVLLCGAVIAEVASTLSLRVAATGRRAWYAPVVLGYVIAFALLSCALRTGMPTGCGPRPGSCSPRCCRACCSERC